MAPVLRAASARFITPRRIFSTFSARRAKPYDVPGPHMVRSTLRGTQQRRQKCVVLLLPRLALVTTQCGLWRMPTSRSGYCDSACVSAFFPGKTSQNRVFSHFLRALRGLGGARDFWAVFGCTAEEFLMVFLGGPLAIWQKKYLQFVISRHTRDRTI